MASFPKCTHQQAFDEIKMPDEVYAHRLYDLARKYYKGAEALSSAEDNPWQPAYFLACHAIELFLKAYLAGKGIVANVKSERYSTHCLACIFEVAKRNGLVVAGEGTELLLEHLRDYTELTRYPELVMMQRITSKEIFDLCLRIQDGVQTSSQMTFIRGALHGEYPAVQVWHRRLQNDETNDGGSKRTLWPCV